MSALLKTGFMQKAGKAVLSVAILSSLALTACSAPASNDVPKGDTGATASASATASAAPKFDAFKSNAFNLDKQVSVSIADLNISTKREGIFLGDGVVGQKKEGDKSSIVFVPYEDSSKAWTYETGSGGVITNLMRWKGKSYIVVLASVKESKAASGMQAAKDTTADNVIVLDAETGKVVNTFKGEPHEVGMMNDQTNIFHLDNIVRKDDSPRDKEFVRPFMVGLVYVNWTGDAKLVDPVTGATVATDKLNGNGSYAKLNNEAGFIPDMNQTDYLTNNEIFMKGVFGNFALMEKSVPSEDSTTGGKAYDTFYLVDTVSGKTVSTPMKCGAIGHGLSDAVRNIPIYSPDFRYVKFTGNLVFDTQTGKSFCDTPKENKDMRQLPVSVLDNEGNMYGLAQRDYLRVSLADITKSENLLTDVSLTEDQQPVFITDKGAALFWMDDTHKSLVTVPAK